MRVLPFAGRTLIAGVLAGLTLFGFGGQALAYPTPWSIGVPKVRQEKTSWCWAAAAQSILKYYNTTVTQCQFVGYVKGTSPNCANAVERALAKVQPTIMNSDQGGHFTSPTYIRLLQAAGV